MKLLICISICILSFILNIAEANKIYGRGLATVMTFDNSTMDSSNVLDKRGGRGTWYSGTGLKHAACYGRKGLPEFSAKPHNMIGAMAMHHFEECYKCMKITNNRRKSRTVIVKIIDKCAGCKVGKAIDLSPAAFRKLADLEQGVVDISWKVVRCPKDIEPRMGPKRH
ncbi:uncharacterized protein BX663DRAFT_506587 [Cokeromyces recurvatus]|uniref:uncharacterized protein n=1 Tax=Cokeromyces recurvatus TaxID=90255 RepID=UPI00221FBD11|nr:uncharacterized protein BX663DRAFT_506587 [Cokeromyces recurvatus]KAI7903463.1 hypothetical protein BX663DRAFT_506587 [Cokeromyces recurvatus]